MDNTNKSNPSFSLGTREMSFIESMVVEGRFGNKTEVVRAALRLLEDYENNMELERLRSKIKTAELSIAEGKGIEYIDGNALALDIIKRGEERLETEN